MKALKKYVAGLIFITVIVNNCQSQNIQYRSKIRPNVKAKLDSLYPHATDVILDQSQISDSTQKLRFNCNCSETEDVTILIFDTNANLLYKEEQYDGSLSGLPDTITRFIQKNTGPKVKFFNEYDKCINKKGEISYNIFMQESLTPYILKFKPSGELISKEVEPGGEQ